MAYVGGAEHGDKVDDLSTIDILSERIYLSIECHKTSRARLYHERTTIVELLADTM